MKSILEQLYNGEIVPMEAKRTLLQEYRKSFSKKEENFLSKLDELLQREFEILMDEYITIFEIDMAEEYINGFKLGVRMMHEVFAELNNK